MGSSTGIGELWLWVLALAVPLIQISAAVHVLLRKRDVRAAVGWMGLIWFAPIIGSVVYVLFGINRIQRKAKALRSGADRYEGVPGDGSYRKSDLEARLGPERRHLAGLVPLGDRVTDRPLLTGNLVMPLVDGDEAYPAMLEAIGAAKMSITLLSYIFDNDHAGKQFLAALAAAVERGVEVRVLIDDVGSRYSVPPMVGALRRAGVRVARFMPTKFHVRLPYLNLRNHRKIMVVDGSIAFTGGMNIREEFWAAANPDHFARDLHFRIEGPVVGEIQEVFAEDWTFTTDEWLEGERWFPSLDAAGSTIARGISDGPDVDYEQLENMLLGAVGTARESVRILTPYFLPDHSLVRTLCIAAQRGVEVDVLLPEKGNLAMVQWASTALQPQVLEKGVRVYASPEPFDHSKLMVVDGTWVLLGSANWDPRSLQLNFEFNVECYDPELGERMERLFVERRTAAREVTLEEVEGRPLPIKLRDSFMRLFSPYL